MRKLKLFLVGAVALALLVPAPLAQAAPKTDLIAGSGTWNGGAFGTPTVHVNANERNPNIGQFTFEYAEGYLVQGRILEFEVTGSTACLVGEVTKEQGQDPASPGNERFDVGEYVAIAISEGGPTDYLFNFTPSQPQRPNLCSIAPDIPFDAGTAEFAIFDAD
jgi:hypothetical protein